MNLYSVNDIIELTNFQQWEEILLLDKPTIIGSSDLFKDLFTLTDLSEFVHRNTKAGPEFRLFKDRSFKWEFDEREFNALLDDATLHTRLLEKSIFKLSYLADSISSKTFLNTEISCFYSKGDQCFNDHYDKDDMLMLQFEGSKVWKFTAPSVRYTDLRSYDDDYSIATQGFDFEITVKPGDMLYVPRHWWHKVEVVEGPSLHLTIANHHRNFRDYFEWVIEKQLKTELKFSEFAPSFRDSNVQLENESFKGLEQQCQILADNQQLRKEFFLDNLQFKLNTTGPTAIFLGQKLDDSDFEFQVWPMAYIRKADGEYTAFLAPGGRKLNSLAEYADAFEWILNQDTVSIKQLSERFPLPVEDVKELFSYLIEESILFSTRI